MIKMILEGIPLKRTLTLKQWTSALILFIAFSTATLFYYIHNHADTRFEAFTEEFFLKELQSNPISLHYSIQNPAAYEIEESSLSLPVYHTGEAEDTVDELSQVTEKLNKIDRSTLNESNQYLYQLLDSYLNAAIQTASYPYFSEPLSPSSGIPSELPVLLAEYRFNTVEDIEQYLSILSQIPAYFEGLILYEQEKASAGMFMSDESADKVIKQCMNLMNSDSLQNSTHFLQITFANRLQTLMEQGILTKEQALAYESENDRLLTTVVAPAYDYLADEITLLKGHGKAIGGLAQYEGGRDYYQALVCLQTGSSRDISEIKQLLYQDLQFNYESLIQLLQNNAAVQDMFSQEPQLLPQMSPEEILTCLRTRISQDYPPLPMENNASQITCNVKYIDASLEPYSAPAFYMTPPIDYVYDNTIYINAKDTSGDLEVFTTLAHEGYPGHLYQTVYSQLYWKQADISPLRSVLYYGGFIEGWAMYVELASYDYAMELTSPDHPEAACYYQACRLDRQIQLCLYSLLDIAIHYDGASLDDVRELFASLGSLDDSSIQAVYEYIAEEPGNYLKYYLGYLEIMELKKQAAAVWYESNQTASACNDPEFLYRFHCFLLENGPADYQTLASRLAAY